MVCGVVVALLNAARGGTTPAPFAAPGGTAEPTETRAGGFTEITGPGGMTTRIPAGWPVTRTGEPGVMRADDPAGTSTTLRYGRSATPLADTYGVHAGHARRFAHDEDGYTPVRLERTRVRGLPAVDWEFEYDAPEGRRHVRSVYWVHDGYEYFVHASSTVSSWPRTGRLLDVMLTYSTP